MTHLFQVLLNLSEVSFQKLLLAAISWLRIRRLKMARSSEVKS